jgi:hypothetical protein
MNSISRRNAAATRDRRHDLEQGSKMCPKIYQDTLPVDLVEVRLEFAEAGNCTATSLCRS